MYYQRKAMPRGNKYLYELEVKHRQEVHQAKLRSMKAHVDNAPPSTMGLQRRNLKKEQMMEDRYAQIEHENRILLSKMSDIMQRAGVDNVSEAWQYGHSLNRITRRKELERITQQNGEILRRIQSVTPYYDHWKWEDEAIESERLAESISEYKRKPSGSTRRAHSLPPGGRRVLASVGEASISDLSYGGGGSMVMPAAYGPGGGYGGADGMGMGSAGGSLYGAPTSGYGGSAGGAGGPPMMPPSAPFPGGGKW